jgi:CDP-paratose 2-epimerase
MPRLSSSKRLLRPSDAGVTMNATSGRRLVVTGGAGFVGSNLSIALSERHPDWEIVVLDNLKRRGSEMNLPRLRDAGVKFTHGDVREPSDIAAIGSFDTLVECSAEPSVLAGVDGNTQFAVHSNLVGAYNCLEAARSSSAQVVFLSTSRVYPVKSLESLDYREADTRFELNNEQPLEGASAEGIAETFPLEGARTLYGATKLGAELLITEYAESFGLPTVVNRCGVITGPWQMGKVDQGVFTYWMLGHYFRRELSYIGYGGSGKQVRDLLHVDDLVELIDDQVLHPDDWAGQTYNVGGGRACSLSLLETTQLCRELTGHDVPVHATDQTRPGDVRIYISDCARLHAHTDWRARRTPRDSLADILEWVRANEAAVKAALG